MADERSTPSGWLPPVAPGRSGPEPPSQPQPTRPTFTRTSAAPGARNPQAVWALGLSIAALALLLISFGTLFIFTLPCSFAAWSLARQASRRIDDGETTSGSGQAVAALWIARIGAAAGVAAAVAVIALVASGVDLQGWLEDLQRDLEERRGSDGEGVRTTLPGLPALIGR